MLLPLIAHLHRFRRETIARVPQAFLTNAHELALAAALMLLGISLLAQGVRPGSVLSQAPFWMSVVWAIALTLGGAATLFGVFRNHRRMEWAGLNLTGHGCAFYALAVATSAGLAQGGAVVLVFSVLALVSYWQAFIVRMTPYVQARQINETAAKVIRQNGAPSE